MLRRVDLADVALLPHGLAADGPLRDVVGPLVREHRGRLLAVPEGVCVSTLRTYLQFFSLIYPSEIYRIQHFDVAVLVDEICIHSLSIL